MECRGIADVNLFYHMAKDSKIESMLPNGKYQGEEEIQSSVYW